MFVLEVFDDVGAEDVWFWKIGWEGIIVQECEDVFCSLSDTRGRREDVEC